MGNTTDKDSKHKSLKEALADPAVVKTINEKCEHIFKSEDKDKSGTLNIKEFTHTCRKYNKLNHLPEPTDEQVSEAYNEFDDDHNGELTLDEFKRMIFLILGAQAEMEEEQRKEAENKAAELKAAEIKDHPEEESKKP